MRYLLLLTCTIFPLLSVCQPSDREKILKQSQSFSTNELMEYATELTSPKYKGRLSGSPEFLEAAKWAAGKFQEWGVKPANHGSYFQYFNNAYTEVFSTGSIVLHGKPGPGQETKLKFPEDFYPGSNSASGSVTGEMVYVGFGITAPELNWDDYAGIDVKGKIVVMEYGLPWTKNDSTLKKWTPYDYHRYKFKNAQEHGASGLLYISKVANPNTSYQKNFIYAHIDNSVAEQVFKTAGKNYTEYKIAMVSDFAPASFDLGQTATITAMTKNFPDSRSCNVTALIEGSDPVLKNEVIILGAHLDGQGYLGTLFPGALDNASGVCDVMAAARALVQSKVRPKRSVLFILFGGEECGLFGSEYYVKHPLFPVRKVVCMTNLDMVGNGTGFSVENGLSYPGLFKFFRDADNAWIHRNIQASALTKNYGRPRSDASNFENTGYKTFSLYTTGSVKPVYYHQPFDNTESLTPDIMEDAAKLLYFAVLGLANDELN